VDESFDNPHIVEIGTVRRTPDDPDLPGDGNSTCIFAWYVKNYKGTLTAVDISEESIKNCKINLDRYDLNSSGVTLLVKDGLSFLGERTDPIQALYIDAFDWGPSEKEKQKSIEWHLEAFKEAEHLLLPGSVIMFDDVMDQTYKGKGQLAIPYALSSGNYEKIFHEYQVILRKK
jgi:predicted O-methyltransferase YrrM